MPRQRQRRTRPADHTGPCRRCHQPIKAGQPITADRREFSHPACARLHITAPATEQSRFVVGSVVGKNCDGCGFPILEGEPTVTVMTVPWHRECRTRR